MSAARPTVRGVIALIGCALLLASCAGSSASTQDRARRRGSSQARAAGPAGGHSGRRLPIDVYRYDRAGDLSPTVAGDPALVYVPNSESNTVDVISQTTYKIVDEFPTGELPQHVTPAYNLKTLYVDNDVGNTLTPIDPLTGRPGTPIPVEDPYNLYFTPDGRYAIVVEERLQTLAFRDPNTMRLEHTLYDPQCCRPPPGRIDHL